MKYQVFYNYVKKCWVYLFVSESTVYNPEYVEKISR